eukprot:COSAG06_NODE_5770_length_3280_cov_8.943100_2_plen_86_part_00
MLTPLLAASWRYEYGAVTVQHRRHWWMYLVERPDLEMLFLKIRSAASGEQKSRQPVMLVASERRAWRIVHVTTLTEIKFPCIRRG